MDIRKAIGKLRILHSNEFTRQRCKYGRKRADGKRRTKKSSSRIRKSGYGFDIHQTIGKLPRPKKGFVMPNHKYTGPFNPLEQQLDSWDRPVAGQEPFNAVDAISMRHDICYRDHGSVKGGKHKCDEEMLSELTLLNPKTMRERFDKSVVKKLIGAKRKLGMGLDLDDPLTDELHRPIKKTFEKRQVFAKKVDDIWAADLVDMKYYSRTNKGYKYLLTIIDVFSKYGWIIPLKNKSGPETVRAFTELWDEKGQKPPKLLWTDKGKEFDNKLFLALLAEKNVHLYWTQNEEKSCIVERWNRTMKRDMWKYFTKYRTGVYYNILPELVAKYNATYHRSIKTTPSDARKPSNYQHVFDALYKTPIKRRKKGEQVPKFHIGDQVRISRAKKLFEKGYTANWTEEVFNVTAVQRFVPFTYKLQDTRGEAVTGTFYEPELQLATPETYRIEKVLRRRTNPQGEREIYVKWLGYTSKFNQWIPESNIE